jgi:hypothetical protein
VVISVVVVTGGLLIWADDGFSAASIRGGNPLVAVNEIAAIVIPVI